MLRQVVVIFRGVVGDLEATQVISIKYKQLNMSMLGGKAIKGSVLGIIRSCEN
jgi:hypothetical protein